MTHTAWTASCLGGGEGETAVAEFAVTFTGYDTSYPARWSGVPKLEPQLDLYTFAKILRRFLFARSLRLLDLVSELLTSPRARPNWTPRPPYFRQSPTRLVVLEALVQLCVK